MIARPDRVIPDAATPRPELEEVGCPLCGRSGHPVVVRDNGYCGRRCDACALIYVSPRPRSQEIRNLYAHDEAQTPVLAHFAGGAGHRLHARHTLRLLGRYLGAEHPSPVSLLEIGPGAGYLLDEARRAGFEPHGIEMSGALATFIETRLAIPCSTEPLSATSFGDRRFDVIYHCDVASHFYDPVREFRLMHEKLSDGGLAVFETGNLGDVGQAHLDRIGSFQYPDHLYFFGEKSLAEILRRTGFDVLAVARYSLAPQAFLIGAVERLKAALHGHGEGRATPDTVGTEPLPSALEQPAAGILAPPRQRMRQAYQGLSFALRYVIGAHTWHAGHPQTLIVVARRC